MRIKALQYAQTHQNENLEGLKTALRIPSISTLSNHEPDIRRMAAWLATKFESLNFENVMIMETGGHPIVYADWLHAGEDAPTVLIYGHYDVQPVDPLTEWETAPFEPTVRGEKLYARGADDNKGQHYVHVAAIEAYMKSSGRLPINVKLLIEGEEEVGSPNLRNFLQTHHQQIQADVGIISDTHIIDPTTPVIVTGVRGLAYMEITLQGSLHDLHSGSYGGVVANPLNVLTRMLGSLHDDEGRVTIPGFYDNVQPLSMAERTAINNGGITAERLQMEVGAPALWGENGYTVAERVGARPTLDIHGIKGGFTGEGAKTVIPAEASAKISMRLVPNQQAQNIVTLFTQHIQNICPPTMRLTVTYHSAENGAVIPIDNPAIKKAAEAYEFGFGQQPLYIREGGTIPVVDMLQNMLNIPVVMMGFGLPDDYIHAPNERFHLPNFYRGIETVIHYYDLLRG